MSDTKILITDQKLAEKVDAATPRTVDVGFLEPWKMVAIRATRTYIQTLVGLLVVHVVANPTAMELWQILLTDAGVSLAPAVISLLQNTGEVLADWDTEKPELRG